MLNNIAVWGGIVGMAVAVLALLLMLFAKKDLKDMLNRDVILFDQNFALKKQAIEKAFKLLDDLEQSPSIISNAEFVRLAKQSYNELFCVVTNQKLAEQFKALALNNGALTADSLAKFKCDCRRDIGFKAKFVRQNPNLSQPLARPMAAQPAETATPDEQTTAGVAAKTSTRTTKK